MRWAHYILSALFLAIVVCWIASHRQQNMLALQTRYHGFYLVNTPGELLLINMKYDFQGGNYYINASRSWNLSFERNADPYDWAGYAGDWSTWKFLMFSGYRDGHPPALNAEGPEPNGWSFSSPDWVLLLITGLVPGWAIFQKVRSKSAKAGHCAKCGYDLRATPGRCPECGKVHATGAGG